MQKIEIWEWNKYKAQWKSACKKSYHPSLLNFIKQFMVCAMKGKLRYFMRINPFRISPNPAAGIAAYKHTAISVHSD